MFPNHSAFICPFSVKVVPKKDILRLILVEGKIQQQRKVCVMNRTVGNLTEKQQFWIDRYSEAAVVGTTPTTLPKTLPIEVMNLLFGWR